MSRYINADSYRAKWADIFDSAYGDSCCEMFKKSIDEQPTADVVKKEKWDRLLENSIILAEAVQKYQLADVVEVVRCRDCTWWKSIFSWNGKEHKVCVRDASEPPREQNDFCSYGERREDAEAVNTKN